MPKLNIKNPTAYVAEAANWYGLDVTTVVEEMERGFEDAMSYVTGYDVQAWLEFNEDELDIKLFAYMGRNPGKEDDLRKREFDLESITPNAVHLINSRIRQRLEIKQTLNDCRALVPMIGEVYEGRITDHPASGQPLRVELYKEIHGILETIHASCMYGDQPIHERSKYALGQSRMWQVKSVYLEKIDADRIVKILLTRSTKVFPQVLMRKLCQDSIPYSKLGEIVCIKRMPGIYTLLATEQKLPPKAIARLSEELSEKIRIMDPETYRRVRNNGKQTDVRGANEVYLSRQVAAAR